MLNIQKTRRDSSSKALSKALSVDNSSNDEFEEETNKDDEFSFMSRKIKKMWKNKNESRWKNSSKKFFNKRKDKKEESSHLL